MTEFMPLAWAFRGMILACIHLAISSFARSTCRKSSGMVSFFAFSRAVP
ncbi:MAG: hypothetical protein BWY99_02743 [Synergistetes bacterium ADurb.BinA166]|nr:MAG: hypothetical protein BWY99_02743 [Synergistetes bacterium ADurb.BinA166]